MLLHSHSNHFQPPWNTTSSTTATPTTADEHHSNLQHPTFTNSNLQHPTFTDDSPLFSPFIKPFSSLFIKPFSVITPRILCHRNYGGEGRIHSCILKGPTTLTSTSLLKPFVKGNSFYKRMLEKCLLLCNLKKFRIK